MTKSKTTRVPFYKCERCNINSNVGSRMCPCPRGSCEAICVGEVKTTVITEIILKPKPTTH